MIMRVGGRLQYLQEPESVFTAQGNKKEGMWQRVCVRVCAFTQYVQTQGVEIFDGPVDSESKHNNKQFHQPIL